jgi:hypothetical protein
MCQKCKWEKEKSEKLADIRKFLPPTNFRTQYDEKINRRHEQTNYKTE